MALASTTSPARLEGGGGEGEEREGRREGGEGEVKGKTFSMFGDGHGILVKKYECVLLHVQLCTHTGYEQGTVATGANCSGHFSHRDYGQLIGTHMNDGDEDLWSKVHVVENS